MYQCKVCNHEFKQGNEIQYKLKNGIPLKFPAEDYLDLCSHHRKYKKNCPVCNIIHYNQGVACCSEHAYILKQKTWMKSNGAPHNFSKNALSRKNWEKRLLEEEGITNVFQRESVKNKIKETISDKYGNGEFLENISQSKLWKDAYAFNYIQKYGLDAYIEKTIYNNSTRSIYYHNVWSITYSQLKKHAKEMLGYSLEEIKEINKSIPEYKNYLSIDHKFSTIQGFIQNVSPLIIGNINNLEILTVTTNSAKNSKCSITLTELNQMYDEYNKN